MTTVTLSELLSARDESLTIHRSAWRAPRWLTRSWAWAREVGSVRVGAWVVAIALTLAGLLHRHGLVLGGLTAFVVAAATVAPALAWVVAGVSLLFLEVRRR